MSVHNDSTGIDRDARIRAIAYSMWEEEGQPSDRAEAHWLRACELVDSAEGKAEAILNPDWLKRTEAVTAEVSAERVPEQASVPVSEALLRVRKSRAA